MVQSNNGSGGRRGRNGEAIAESMNFGPLATWVGFNLRMAQEAAFQAFSRRSLEVGESPGRFATLTLIARNPGISQTELSQAAGRDKSSLTPVVEDLVRRGLVERKRMRNDRGYWLSVEQYVSEHSDAQFTHGICPECMHELYPEYAEPEGGGEGGKGAAPTGAPTGAGTL